MLSNVRETLQKHRKGACVSIDTYLCKRSHTQGCHQGPTQIPSASHDWLREYSAERKGHYTLIIYWERLNKLVRRASSVLDCPLDSTEVRMLDNTSQPLHDTGGGGAPSSSFSSRLLHPQCEKDTSTGPSFPRLSDSTTLVMSLYSLFAVFLAENNLTYLCFLCGKFVSTWSCGHPVPLHFTLYHFYTNH